LKFILL
jgi:hypothetical protein